MLDPHELGVEVDVAIDQVFALQATAAIELAEELGDALGVQEIGAGVRLPPYDVSADELLSAIGRLLVDRPTRERLTEISAPISRSTSTLRSKRRSTRTLIFLSAAFQLRSKTSST